MHCPRLPVAVVVIVVMLSAACKREEGGAAQGPLATLPRLTISVTTKGLFTYYSPEGKFESTTSIDQIPKERRGWVRVVDLALKPEKRIDHEMVYVADLRQELPDKTYFNMPLSRRAFEMAAQSRIGQGAGDKLDAGLSAATKTDQVILYSTSWCPACRSARSYLTKKGISFVEKDIEKDQAAAGELMRKAQATGVAVNGVPVIDVRGTLLPGFDPSRLESLLGEKK
jgi:glutaredoxin/nitrous oxide reductase accessory protein NosL